MSTDQQARPAPQQPASSARGVRAAGALCGVLAAAVTLGVAELAAALVGRTASPVVVVGGAFVDRTPRWLKEYAIRRFGEDDKAVLVGGILVVLVLVAAALGAVAVRRLRVGYAGVALLGAVGAAAALSRPQAQPLDALPSLAGALAGAAALHVLLVSAVPGRPVDRSGARRAVPGARRVRERLAAGDRRGGLDRRGLLLAGLWSGVVAVAAGGLGRVLLRRSDAAASRAAVRLPRPASPAPPLPAGVEVAADGVAPFVTPNRSFYRVDTALVVPQVRAEDWSLRVHGMVERELRLDFAELLARPLLERDITLTCVSNEVGGPLVGSARWLGAPLADLLAEAGVRSGATQLVARSVDGMTIGTPVSAVMDGRDALLAVGMNGEPLPAQHGFPVRMVVPGLYGYVSACKWLVDLELTTFDAYDAYWVDRGWAEEAPIKVSSRIDTPKAFARVEPGTTVPVAGVAWAQTRGIARVEVRVDGGPWQEARLGASAGDDTWRQWVWPWAVEGGGSHTLQVRATDADGVVQVEERATPFPSGSTGWHSVVVTGG
ncbi:molybdopterin-dependent oxidoreductase [Vallicoccus soli]|uniref:Molybdopterin-binding oxidoreductase n=1 Tax=Vallicoccus soli TaxID=2339232 RepID=A0A3A3Z367_9ACTN|nr:molybdopterin-dependent oxidoreductase [Vallicoccus soli]RJK97154.1 molybdopterin-binding oxidoreductase [Vallicoccus soli]